MQLEQLILTNFKNYHSQRIACADGLNCFIGLNGMGKTNLLDAVYYLCMGKSHFQLNDRNIVRHSTDFFRLEGHFRVDDRVEKIVAKVRPGKKKELLRNGVAYQRLSDHIGLLPVVFIAPDDTYLISEGSEARRRFLDNTLCQLDHRYLHHLILYNKVLRQRNALLKRFLENDRREPELLEVYDQQLFEPARYIHERRRAFVGEFAPRLVDIVNILSSEREQVDCRYQSKINDRSLEQLLKESLGKDLVLGRTTAGIHKDDLIFTLNDHPIRNFGSQGQLKSFILALKLAQYELLRQHKQTAPLLLLDDIFDKLDGSRVQHLLEMLLVRQFGQIFITDTHESRLESIIREFATDYRIFEIENGQLKNS